MIIDLHVHHTLGPEPRTDFATMRRLKGLAKQVGINRVCLLGNVFRFGIRANDSQIRLINDSTLELVRAGFQRSSDVNAEGRIPDHTQGTAIDFDGSEVMHRSKIQEIALTRAHHVESHLFPVGCGAGEILDVLVGVPAPRLQFRERHMGGRTQTRRERNLPCPGKRNQAALPFASPPRPP